jgi:hypothetical protein
MQISLKNFLILFFLSDLRVLREPYPLSGAFGRVLREGWMGWILKSVRAVRLMREVPKGDAIPQGDDVDAVIDVNGRRPVK